MSYVEAQFFEVYIFIKKQTSTKWKKLHNYKLYLHESKIPWFFKSNQRSKSNNRKKIKNKELVQQRHAFIICFLAL